MALTSLGGTLLMGYSLLGLIDHFGKIDAVTWAERRPVLLNSFCVAVALVGWAVQFSLERADLPMKSTSKSRIGSSTRTRNCRNA